MKDALEIEKIKELPIKGTAKIEIFENGELVREIKKNNYVNKKARELTAMVISSGRGNTISYSLSGQIGETLYGPPNVVSLHYNELPANPEGNEIPLGELIGFGQVGMTAISTINGTYNQIESVTDKTFYRKLVYDFPSSSGNGRFNNIYSYNASSGDYSNLQGRTYYPTTHPNGILGVPVIVDTKVFLLLREGGDRNSPNNKLLEFPKSKLAKFYTGTMLTSDFTVHSLGINVSNLTYHNGFFYFFEVGTRNLRRSPVTNPTNVTLAKAFTANELYDARYISIMKNPVTNFFYIMVSWTGQPAEGSLYVVDASTFAVVDRMVHPGMTADGYYFMAFDSSGTYLTYYNKTLDVKNKKSTSAVAATYIDRRGPLGAALFADHQNALSFSTPHCFSRLVLDSDVVKTASQTMKITYEFTMDEPTWGY